MHADITRLRVNVHDTCDFAGDLPEVLKSVVARLQAKADEPEGEVARQAMVLLHETLRRVKVSRAAGGSQQ